MDFNFYETCKSFLKAILPVSFFKKNKHWLRRISAIIYFGWTYKCNICQANLSHFPITRSNGYVCPVCGSLERTRTLWSVLHSLNIDEDDRILHFSAPDVLIKKLTEKFGLKYLPTDITGEFNSSAKYDITKIPESDCQFGLIICFHILEHIQDDYKAIVELYRVLKNGGICLIQTPYKEGKIYEDPRVVSPNERLIRFGQRDHIRVYSLSGLKERVENAGFKVSIFREPDCIKGNKYALSKSPILICQK